MINCVLSFTKLCPFWLLRLAVGLYETVIYIEAVSTTSTEFR